MTDEGETDEGKLEGGCQCGAIRYRLEAAPRYVCHCHCGMCRRAGGAPVVSWAALGEDEVSILSGGPRWYRSSDHARRGFCPNCGTPLFFHSTHYPGAIDVTVGSLDEPERLKPDFHVYEPDRIPWLHIDDGLPRHIEDSRSPLL
jgi:hypothetical protein